MLFEVVFVLELVIIHWRKKSCSFMRWLLCWFIDWASDWLWIIIFILIRDVLIWILVLLIVGHLNDLVILFVHIFLRPLRQPRRLPWIDLVLAIAIPIIVFLALLLLHYIERRKRLLFGYKVCVLMIGFFFVTENVVLEFH